LADHGNYTAAEKNGQAYGMIVIEPQAAGNWTGAEIEESYQWLKDSLYPYINWKKVYLTGQSLGGGGTFRYLSINKEAHKLFAAASPHGSGGHQWFVSTANEINVINTQVPIWAFHNRGDKVVWPSASTTYFHDKWKAQKGTAKFWVSINDLDGHTFPGFNRGKGSSLSDGLKYLVNPSYISRPAVNLYEWLLSNEIGKPAVAPRVITVSHPNVPTTPITPKPDTVKTPPVVQDTVQTPFPVDTVKPAPARIGKLRGVWVASDPNRKGAVIIEAHYTTGVVRIHPDSTNDLRSLWVPMDTTKTYTPTITFKVGTKSIPARK
jgi:dienelactone hydrolase